MGAQVIYHWSYVPTPKQVVIKVALSGKYLGLSHMLNFGRSSPLNSNSMNATPATPRKPGTRGHEYKGIFFFHNIIQINPDDLRLLLRFSSVMIDKVVFGRRAKDVTHVTVQLNFLRRMKLIRNFSKRCWSHEWTHEWTHACICCYPLTSLVL